MKHHRQSLRTAYLLAALALLASVAWPQAIELVHVTSKVSSRIVELPGEFQAFQSVAIHAKLRGYVDRIPVDRGTNVKRGQLLVQLSAPEMAAQIAEAESKIQAAEADRLQAQAQLAAAQSTSDRLQKASETQGAIAGNELVQAQKQVEAAQALVRSKQQSSVAAEAALRQQRDLSAYLRITAPFDGVVTERLVHPGALVGPGADPVLLTIQEISHLRLVVAVPEEDVAGISPKAHVEFHVPAYPARTFTGAIARNSHAIDAKTRTMAVELDVFNRDGSLSPGMYPTVKWPVRTAGMALFVPRTSVVTTTERTFVIRSRNGRAEWVDVRKGITGADQLQVLGDLQPGDAVVRRATDEIRPGASLRN